MPIVSSLKKNLILILMIPMLAFGQATLKGTITDADKKEALFGAGVMVVGTSLGAPTDIEGQYRVVGIPERVCSIKVSYMGYETQIVEVDFSKTKDAQLNIQMRPMVIEGQEVVVTAQMRGQNAAINQQVRSDRIINVVSEEKIKELPDANAAEAIGRLPGVAIQRNGGEASKVVLRGLSSQYSNITVDGVTIPGTDANRKDVDLSMISQGSLAGVELSKTLLPDQDGDAIAGAVNLVTRKAPSETEIKLELKGGYNHVMKSQDQYEVSGAFATRFFNDILGVQVRANSEKKIRSREYVTFGYVEYNNPLLPKIAGVFNSYNEDDVKAQFTDEVRSRNGGQLIFDVNTPDNGTIKLSSVYASTQRNYLLSERDYDCVKGLFNNYEYVEQVLSTENASLQGKNFLLGMDIDWGVSYAQSTVKNPYDYRMEFFPDVSLMGGNSGERFDPLFIINHAKEEYTSMACTTSSYKKQENLDKERAAYLNITKKYTLSDLISGALKIGAKYKERERWMNNFEANANDYLPSSAPLENSDGSFKQYDGTRFEPFFDKLIESGKAADRVVRLPYFIDYPATSRNLMGIYKLMPLISADALREWYEINKNGKSLYGSNGSSALQNYTLKERVASGFIMNTLNIGQSVTLITGVRIEQEKNDYTGTSSIGGLNNYGFIVNTFLDSLGRSTFDSTSRYTETMVLPNIQVAIRPTEYLTVRLAAYRALARPDYNLRLPRFYKFGTNAYTLGNTSLKNMKAWNFEVNTQVHDATLGLISISAFYKVIDNLYHQTSAISLTGGTADSLKGLPFSDFMNAIGSTWQTTMPYKKLMAASQGKMVISIPYSSPDPSYAWGFEFEHQLNFSFLPVSFLKNMTLSYNISVTRSETNIYTGVTGMDILAATPHTIGGFPVWTAVKGMQYYVTIKRQSEDQPNFYGNASLGYDIGGFSSRLSVFYQQEFVSSYPSDILLGKVGYTSSFTKWDLTLKQKFSNYVSLYLNINNLTNAKQTKSSKDNNWGWDRLTSEELYGATADFGVIITM
jgi:TonB-dependent receptor